MTAPWTFSHAQPHALPAWLWILPFPQATDNCTMVFDGLEPSHPSTPSLPCLHTYTPCTTVQVADGLEPSHPDAFQYCNVRVSDSPSEDLVAHFPKCFAFIDEALQQGGRERDGGGRSEGRGRKGAARWDK